MTYLRRVSDYLPPSSESRGRTRVVDTVATSVVLGGAILGAGYGGRVAIIAPLIAFLFGGFVFRWNRYRLDREIYGNVLLGLFFGTVLAWLALSTLVALSLHMSIISVIWSTATKMIMNVVVVSVLLLVGFAAALVFAAIGLPSRDVTALLLLAAGVVGFALVQVKIAALMPNCGDLCRPMLSKSAYTRYLGFQVAGIVAAGVGFAGFLGLVRSRTRLRAVLGLLVALGLIVGTSGVGNVFAQIKYAQSASSVDKQMSVTGEEFSMDGNTMVVVLEIHNPSSETVIVTSGYFRAQTADDASIGYGAGILASGDAKRIPPGETGTVTYRIELTASQARQVRNALQDGGFTLSGKATLRLRGTDSAAISAFGDRSGFVVRFECGVTDDSIRCPTE